MAALTTSLFRSLAPADRERLAGLRERAPLAVRLVAPVEHPTEEDAVPVSSADVGSGRVESPAEVPAPVPSSEAPIGPAESPEQEKLERLREAMARRLRVTIALKGHVLEGVPRRWIGAGTLLVLATAKGPAEIPLPAVRRVEVHDDSEARRTSSLMMQRQSLVRVRTCDGHANEVGVIALLKSSTFVLRTTRGETMLRSYGAILTIEELGPPPVKPWRRR